MLVSEAEARTEKWCPFNRQRHNTVCDIHAERTWAWLRIPVRRRVL